MHASLASSKKRPAVSSTKLRSTKKHRHSVASVARTDTHRTCPKITPHHLHRRLSPIPTIAKFRSIRPCRLARNSNSERKSPRWACGSMSSWWKWPCRRILMTRMPSAVFHSYTMVVEIAISHQSYRISRRDIAIDRTKCFSTLKLSCWARWRNVRRFGFTRRWAMSFMIRDGILWNELNENFLFFSLPSQIKACMDVGDCQPDFCLDIYESNNKRKRCSHILSRSTSRFSHANFLMLISHLSPTIGHGRKRRAIEHDDKNMTEYTKFKENLQYTVLMPGESSAIDLRDGSETCKNFVMITGLLAGLLALSTVIVSWSFARILNMDLNFVFPDLRTRLKAAERRQEKYHWRFSLKHGLCRTCGDAIKEFS